MGVTEVQLHEPALVMFDSSASLASMFRTAYVGDKASFATTYVLERQPERER